MKLSDKLWNWGHLEGSHNNCRGCENFNCKMTPEQYAEEISKYFIFFNTEPSYMGTVIHGITAAMEEKRANDGDIFLMHDLHGTTVDGAIMAMEQSTISITRFINRCSKFKPFPLIRRSGVSKRLISSAPLIMISPIRGIT